jgi:hypothetical protein
VRRYTRSVGHGGGGGAPLEVDEMIDDVDDDAVDEVDTNEVVLASKLLLDADEETLDAEVSETKLDAELDAELDDSRLELSLEEVLEALLETVVAETENELDKSRL